MDGYKGEGRGGKGIHRNWISRAIIIINLIKVQTVYQAGVWFCYKCSRLMPGSAISVPDRQVSGSAISVPDRQVSGSGGN